MKALVDMSVTECLNEALKIGFTALAIMFLTAGMLFGMYHAMDGEMKFQDNIRKSRCATGKYPAKYCEGL